MITAIVVFSSHCTAFKGNFFSRATSYSLREEKGGGGFRTLKKKKAVGGPASNHAGPIGWYPVTGVWNRVQGWSWSSAYSPWGSSPRVHCPDLGTSVPAEPLVTFQAPVSDYGLIQAGRCPRSDGSARFPCGSTLLGVPAPRQVSLSQGWLCWVLSKGVQDQREWLGFVRQK